MRNILTITAIALVLGVACATNYCQKSCGNSRNIGCNNNGAWDPSCSSDRALVTLTAAEKNMIVHRHNFYRNHIAGGRNKRLRPACRMATMRWNNELAYLASLNVRSCQMRHDACRNTDQFDWAGQNLAWVSYYNPLNTRQNIFRVVRMWYNEVVDMRQSYIDSYPSNYNGPAIGHFTVMMADRNTHVGCAVATYSVKGQPYKAFLMACNYAATNVYGVKMYSSCAVGGTQCTTGVNPKYKFLCSGREYYNPNNLNY